MSEKVIKLLEKELGNKELTLDGELKIINNPSIRSSLDVLFGDKKNVLMSKLSRLTSNEGVMKLLETYFSEKGIEIDYDDAFLSMKKGSNPLIDQYYTEMSQYCLLDPEEEKELFMKYANANSEEERFEIRSRIAEANLRLVVSIAKRYSNRGVEILDLIQEGNMGLLTALDKFDYKSGYKFSTYATWWIRQAVLKSIMMNSSGLYVPLNARTALGKAKKVIEEIKEFYDENGEEFKLDDRVKYDVARQCNISIKTLELLLGIKSVISLDQPVPSLESEFENAILGDAVDDPNVNVEEEAVREAFNNDIRQFLVKSTLTARELEVIKKRYGFDSGTPMRLDDVAEELSVSRERIRQIEGKALKKLRHPSQLQKLRSY